MPTHQQKKFRKGEVVSFHTGRRRRDVARLAMLQEAYRQAVAGQARAAERLEQALHDLEQASHRAEQAAWALSVAEQRRTTSLSFVAVMGWLADICKVRSRGEHFCLAELVRSADPSDAAGA